MASKPGMEAHRMIARFVAGDPFGFAGGGGDFSIESHGGFDGHEGGAADDPVVEGFVELGAVVGEF